MSYLKVLGSDVEFNNLSKDFINGIYYVNSTRFLSQHILESDMKPRIIDILSRGTSYQMDALQFDIQDSKGYSQNIKALLENINDVKRYAIADHVFRDPILLDFDNIEFLNGVYTCMRWTPNRKLESNIISVHDNGQLCHQYIKNDIKNNYDPIRDIILNNELVVRDLIDIIIDYYPNICRYYELYGNNNQKYMHCDTLCEIDEDLCEICKLSIAGKHKFPLVSVRLEVD